MKAIFSLELDQQENTLTNPTKVVTGLSPGNMVYYACYDTPESSPMPNTSVHPF